MDAIKAAGWTRFKPVKGQPIAEQDMRKVKKLPRAAFWGDKFPQKCVIQKGHI